MPFVTALLTGLATLLGPMLLNFLFSLGVGFITYVGIKALVDAALAQVVALVGGMSAEVVTLLAVMNVDKAITIIFSALAVRLTLMGMNAAGNMSRFKLTRPE